MNPPPDAALDSEALGRDSRLSRLSRLQGYLAQDPDNAGLLAETFDAALAAGEHDAALGIIERAQALQLLPNEWTFRRAQLAIARRELPLAADLLLRLHHDLGGHPVIAHDLAHVNWLQGDLDACRARLAPWVETDTVPPLTSPQRSAVQTLWLRASHRLGKLDEAWAWLDAQRRAGTLAEGALGVASLIAVDNDHFEDARTLADAALAHAPDELEALVARASVAMAERDPARARRLLEHALHLREDDGRTWSTLGYLSLQSGDLGAATGQLRRALVTLPQHIGTWHALGWALLLQSERAQALQAFEQALTLDPSFAETHGALGLVWAMAGDHPRAQHHLDVADRLDARNVTGRYARTWLAGQAGQAGDRAQLAALARRLLDRPGFFGQKTLGDSVVDASPEDDRQA